MLRPIPWLSGPLQVVSAHEQADTPEVCLDSQEEVVVSQTAQCKITNTRKVVTAETTEVASPDPMIILTAV